MFFIEDFISGERFQQVCDVYCGTEEFLLYNPIIVLQPEKHLFLEKLTEPWDNPRFIFCYSSCLKLFQEKLNLVRNPFVLVSHNGDENITEDYITIANHPLLLKWFAQNIMFIHPKIHWLPIGIANSMWHHGNLESIANGLFFSNSIQKEKDIYFFFSTDTNKKERLLCKKILEGKSMDFGEHKSFIYYLQDLVAHKYCISPPGNGIDCHRVWESFYFGTIPILLRSVFTENIAKFFPCILLDSWNDFDRDNILSSYNSDWQKIAQSSLYLRFDTWKQLILDAGRLAE